MARAEKSILHSLVNETNEAIELKELEFKKIPIDRLLHEMSSRQKLIEKVKEDLMMLKLNSPDLDTLIYIKIKLILLTNNKWKN